MKAIVSLNETEMKRSSDIWSELRQKTAGTKREDWFNNFNRKSGYAHYTFSGEVSDKLVELLGRMPTTDEIIMLVDDGFSHFGASCSLYNGTFNGRVNTD